MFLLNHCVITPIDGEFTSSFEYVHHMYFIYREKIILPGACDEVKYCNELINSIVILLGM